MKATSKFIKDEARPFDIADLFFSTTDKKGIITSCNEIFINVSNYVPEELLGKPHNLVRHPDMPRCVFKLLWDYLLAGRSIGAYVKNRAKTGEYYWVFALASPIEEGFLSIRLKPSSNIFPIVEDLYRQLLRVENSFGDDWRAGMEASSKQLMETLGTLKFDSYDAFMGHALHAEIGSRREQLSARPGTLEPSPPSEQKSELYSQIRRIEGHLNALVPIFNTLTGLTELRSDLLNKRSFFRGLGRHIGLIALNAGVRASRLADKGRTLGVISEEVSRVSQNIISESELLNQETETLSSTLHSTAMIVSFSTLQCEMMAAFCKEQLSLKLNPTEQVKRYGKTLEELNRLLASSVNTALGCMAKDLYKLKNNLGSFQALAESLAKILLTIQFSYFTGKTAAARIDGGAQFAILLQEMVSMSTQANDELFQLNRTIGSLQRDVGKWNIDQFSAALDKIEPATTIPAQ